jgi:hypothetical protein
MMYDEPVLDDLKFALGALRRLIDALAVAEAKTPLERVAVAAIIAAWVFYGTMAVVQDRYPFGWTPDDEARYARLDPVNPVVVQGGEMWGDEGACATDVGDPSRCIVLDDDPDGTKFYQRLLADPNYQPRRDEDEDNSQ